jgi:hypothetical protein
MGNANQTAGVGSSMYQGAYGAGGLSQSGYSGAVNTYNTGYQNSMQQYNANQQASAAPWGAIGGLAGMAMGGSFGGALGEKLFGADGGAVPHDLATTPQPGDTVPAMLQEGEFVIPADVVKRKGTEFFDKLLAQYKDGGKYEQQRQGVPV